MTACTCGEILPRMAHREADPDDFYETESFHRRSNWVVAIVALLTLGMVALPFVWMFTAWL